jgi:hypothetical protein
LLKHDTRVKALGLLGMVGWVAIVVLSVLPGSARPHSGASGFSEHFVAYAAVAFCLCYGIESKRKQLMVLVGLIVSSGLLELLQTYIPGRTAELKGLLSAAAGAMLGFCAAWVLYREKS